MKITSNERKLINKILAKYNGYHYPSELQKLWKELDEIGVEVMIHNRTDWREYEWESKDTYTMDGEEVDNSLFIFQVYPASAIPTPTLCMPAPVTESSWTR